MTNATRRDRCKNITDEQVIAALVTNPTIKDAAAAVGLSTRAVYDRMQGREFNKLYTAAKLDILRAAANAVNFRLIQAVETVAGVMNDKSNNAGVRMQAAQYIINSAVKMSAAVNAAEVSATDNAAKIELLGDQIDAEVNKRVEDNMREVMHLLLHAMTPEQAKKLMDYTFNERRRQNSGE